jgi:DNA-directed RNA polymerase sigma subunit (sigma70/sigma32)|tara:strand:+ start:112 stop:345 length:234 start_codon:yes stop_codon:yes gene_type:complete
MSISRKEFESGKFKKVRHEDRLTHPVAVFLGKNNKRAYTVEEICKGTKMNEDAVRSMLRVLKQDKVVVHKSPYFTLK